MSMKIVAAVDRSPFSDKVVEMVIRIAPEDSQVLLVHVAPRDPDIFGQQLRRKVLTGPVPEHLQDRRDLLDRCAAALDDAGIRNETLLVRGDPGPTVAAEAKRWGAELVIMGSHGRGKLYQQLMGSVSESVVSSRQCPVLLIPGQKQK